jgi:arylsulfatase A-like enzyme
MLADLGLGLLLDALAASPSAESTLLAVTSPRGYPLGEHLGVGAANEAQYGELLHVPWFLRLPEGSSALRRTQALVQPADLFATLSDWFGQAVSHSSVWGRSLFPLLAGQRQTLRDRVCAIHNGERALRTAAWFLRDCGDQRELFVKPDDRWEINEVSIRCGSVVDELVVALDQFEQAAQSPPFVDPPPLSKVLAEGFD